MKPQQDLNQAALDLTRDFNAVYDTPAGKRVLDHICFSICGVDKPLFNDNPVSLATQVGMRNVGLLIQAILNRRFDERPTIRRHR